MIELQFLGRGQRVVLIPGLPHPASELLPLAMRLAEAAEVVLVSLDVSPAAGPPAASLDAAADELAHALASGPEAVWVGCSFGFWRAVHLLTSGRVGRARGLAGLGPALDLDTPTRDAFRGAAALVASGADIGDILVARFLSPGFAAVHPEARAAVASFCRGTPPEVLGAEFLAAADAPLVGPAFARLTLPIYLRVGELDLPAPPSSVRAIASQVPHARIDIVPSAGHLLATEDAEGTSRALLQWMKAL